MLWLALHLPADPPSPSPEALACWAGRYTPRVSVASDGLRLDIGASLRLFGGLDALLAQLRAELAAMAVTAVPAVAATPLAAAWLARGAASAVCVDTAATHAALRRLPLSALGFPLAVSRRLTRFGLRTLGEVMDLPRAGLGQRLGKAFVLDLARALGEMPDPQREFVFPEVFAQSLELPAPVEAAPVLQFAARRLIAALVGWLEVRNRAARQLEWRIDHGHGQTTRLPLAFSQPVHAAARIERVLRERLASLRLAAPALALHLQVAQAEVRDGRSTVLFAGPEAGGEAYAELLDRLLARLGTEAVQGLVCHADHRPEAASRTMAVGHANKSIPLALAPRPAWLLPQPAALNEYDGRPQYRGHLRLLAGPERIESGWWDGEDARRDYFIALDSEERWLWIFRDPRIPGWFLHGFFA